MTRQEAKHLNLTRYNGTPCKKCGGTLRFTCSGLCVPCYNENKRIKTLNDPKFREYRRKHSEKNNQKRNSSQHKEYMKNYHRQHIVEGLDILPT